MKNCGICRKTYDYSYTRNTCKYLKELTLLIGHNSVIFLLELFPILYLYIYLDYSNLSNIFLIYGLFSIIFGNIINYNFVETIIQNEQTKNSIINLYVIIKCVYTILIFLILLYFNNIQQFILYIGFIFGVIYTLPLLIFSTLFIINKISNKLNIIKNKTDIRYIKIYSTIYQTILDRTIDNV